MKWRGGGTNFSGGDERGGMPRSFMKSERGMALKEALSALAEQVGQVQKDSDSSEGGTLSEPVALALKEEKRSSRGERLGAAPALAGLAGAAAGAGPLGEGVADAVAGVGDLGVA